MRKVLITTLIILLAALVGAGAYVYNLLDMMPESSFVDEDGTNIKDKSPEQQKEALGISEDTKTQEDTGVTNILLFGLDNRSENEKGHSDTIMIASIDRKNKSVKLTSLLRDMYVPIPGKKDNRINTAYFMGGPALAIKTVNSNFDMNIEDYVTVDFHAMELIIDLVGGIEIDIPQNEIKVINQYIDELNKISRDGSKTNRITKSGLQTLDGRQAVAYARNRYVGRDDFDRTARQRKVMSELFKKGMSISITKIPDLVTTVLPNVTTSLDKTEIIELAVTVLGFGKADIEQFRIPTDDGYTDEWVSDNMLVLKPKIEYNTKLLHEFIYGTEDGPEDDKSSN
jgi:LCP family protein required for cell wall assembly